MNNKAQMGGLGVGTVIMIAITLIVGVILFQSIEQEVGSATTTYTVTNLSLGNVSNATTIYLTDYKAFSDITVIYYNTTDYLELNSGNYTITDNVIDPTTNGLSVSILPTSESDSFFWNVTATVEPVTYISDAGARSVATLIGIFFALSLIVVTLMPTVKDNIMKMMS